ncbi:MAG: GNAT family N-acetyltransferase [Dysgonamonadaceae bacterium]|jgi:GNAT superfamily N-acetyltransferase|nr:GNAT family N-acetyltransferase [Dysgonamonadaceae bacterium]
MDTKFITLAKENIDTEHICCAISDKKCAESYAAKKAWLKREFDNGYVFRRLNERAKVFIEYVPAEKAWIPVNVLNYLMINCFWVSGQYKGKGYAKALLQSAIDDAKVRGKDGLVTVVGTSKFAFMSDPKWFLRQGFEIIEKLPYGFSLLARKLNPNAKNPSFNQSVQSGECEEKNGLVVYYSNRCPFTEYHVNNELVKTAENRNLPLKVIKLETMEQAQSAPSPATIFSLFFNGEFVTTDVSVCMDNRFDKVIKIK